MLPRWVLLVLVCRVTGALSLPATYNQQQTGDLNLQIHLKDVQVFTLLGTDLLDDYTEYDYIYDYADLTVKPIKPTTSSTPSVTTTDKTEVAETVDSSSQNSTLEAPNKTELTETVDSSSQNSTLEAPNKTEVAETVDSFSQNSTSDEPNSESLTANSTGENLGNLSAVEGGKANETSLSFATEKPEGASDESSTMKTRINDKTRKVFEDNDEDLPERNPGGFSVENVTRRMTKKRCRTGYSPDGKGRCRRLVQQGLSLLPLAMKFAPKLLDDLARSTKNLAREEVHPMHSN